MSTNTPVIQVPAPPGLRGRTVTSSGDQPGVRFAVAQAALVATALAAGSAHLPVDLSYAALAAAAVLGVLGLGLVWAAGVGASAWALFTGFTEHAFGTLTFAGPDLARLGVLVVLVIAAAELAGVTGVRRG